MQKNSTDTHNTRISLCPRQCLSSKEHTRLQPKCKYTTCCRSYPDTHAYCSVPPSRGSGNPNPHDLIYSIDTIRASTNARARMQTSRVLTPTTCALRQRTLPVGSTTCKASSADIDTPRATCDTQDSIRPNKID